MTGGGKPEDDAGMKKQRLCVAAITCLLAMLCAVSCLCEASPFPPPVHLSLGGSEEITVTVDQAGEYRIALAYRVPGDSMLPGRISVAVNGEMQRSEHQEMELCTLWADKTQNYIKDLYGNELLPEAVRIGDATIRATLSSTVYGTPYTFSLAQGENVLTVTSLQGDIVIISISVFQPEALPGTEAYTAALPKEAELQDALITLQGEHYSYKNRPGIVAQKSRDIAFIPFDATGNRVNALDGATWADSLDAVTWRFTVDEPGLYHIAFRYRQDGKREYPSYKNVSIDGEPLVQATQPAVFPPTGPSNAIGFLQDDNGESLAFYFAAGDHTLTLESTAAPFEQVHRALRAVIQDMNTLALDVRLISGGRVDQERDWNIEEYMPDLRARLTAIVSGMEDAQHMLGNIALGDQAPEAVAKLEQIRGRLGRFLTEARGLDRFVNQINSFAQNSGSMAETISLLLPDLIAQPLTIDEIYITGNAAAIPEMNVTAGARLAAEVDKLSASFSGNEDVGNMTRDDALNVWMLGSAPQVEVLRELCMEEYGDRVAVSILSDEQKLLLAISSGEIPDVVIGASSLQPYRLAIRGALYDLRTFPDFTDVISCFHEATLVPFMYDDGVYALPQTVNFWCLIYRTDYMESLGLTVPETWEELIVQLPTMYRYGLEVNTVIANVGALKTLLATTPFIMQYNADLYVPDGSDTCFTQPDFMEAFTFMTDLYTKFGLAKSVGSFYNSFINGNIAMGCGDISTYLLLQRSSSGMDGLWDIALMPGIANADGSINRSFPTVSSGSMIMKDTKDPQLAWDFLKWWMQDDVQARYARQLRTTYGEEYVYLSANIRALEKGDFLPAAHQSILLEQISSSKQTPSHPADMLVERALSNAWNNVVIGGMDVRTAIDNAAIEAKRGIDRKLKEFGYMDDMGNMTAPLNMASEETVAAWKKEGNDE